MTITVAKKSVSFIQENLWNISVNVKLNDGSTDVFDRDFSFQYTKGDAVNKKYAELLANIQAAIDIYKAEQALYNNAQFATIVTNLQSALTY